MHRNSASLTMFFHQMRLAMSMIEAIIIFAFRISSSRFVNEIVIAEFVRKGTIDSMLVFPSIFCRIQLKVMKYIVI